MRRIVIISFLVLLFPIPSNASLSRPKEKSLSRFIVAELQEKPKDGGLSITDATEVKINGKICRYEDIPDNAEVILLEVAADHKTVLKLHFRIKEKGP